MNRIATGRMDGQPHRTRKIRAGTQYSPKIIAKILSAIKQLEGLSPTQLARLSRSQVKFWGPEEFIISEGSRNLDQMVIVLEGKVYIRKKLKKEGKEVYEQMTQITGPAIVGENAFFTGLRRSAGVYAKDTVQGIMLDRDNFMRLISLDKVSAFNFMQNMATENLFRAGRTARLYMGTLQLLFPEATSRQLSYRKALTDLSERIGDKRTDILELQNLVRDILMTLRDLNQILKELYIFANLPEVKVKSVNLELFILSPTDKHYHIFHPLIEELFQEQDIVPINSINFKRRLLDIIISNVDKSGAVLDYPHVISIATDAYNSFFAVIDELGIDVTSMEPARDESLDDLDVKDDLLWDELSDELDN